MNNTSDYDLFAFKNKLVDFRTSGARIASGRKVAVGRFRHEPRDDSLVSRADLYEDSQVPLLFFSLTTFLT